MVAILLASLGFLQSPASAIARGRATALIGVVAALLAGGQFNRKKFSLSFGLKINEFWLDIPYTKKTFKNGQFGHVS